MSQFMSSMQKCNREIECSLCGKSYVGEFVEPFQTQWLDHTILFCLAYYCPIIIGYSYLLFT